MAYLRKKILRITIAALIIASGLFFSRLSLGIVNPAATYCQNLGYEWIREKTDEGEIGICKFPDGTTAGDWDFLKGRKGQKWSYCGKKGYELKTISDVNKCSSIYSRDCAVCVLKEGVEIEASRLLGFETQKASCGNGICNSGESLQNCPQDCLGKGNPILFYFGVLFTIVFLGFLIYKGVRKLRKRKTRELMPKI